MSEVLDKQSQLIPREAKNEIQVTRLSYLRLSKERTVSECLNEATEACEPSGERSQRRRRRPRGCLAHSHAHGKTGPPGQRICPTRAKRPHASSCPGPPRSSRHP